MNATTRLADTAPGVALLEGSWTLAEWAGTLAVSRRWDSPAGYAPQILTRVFYGTSWSLMQGVESGIAVAAFGADFAWTDRVRYRTQWMIGTHVPSGCSTLGAEGGCGLGIGSFSSLGFRLRGSNVWIRNDGGWLESRVSTNEKRTLGESTFALVPAEVLYELELGGGRRTRSLGLVLRGGANVVLGIHQAHVHPRPAFVDVYPKNITEMAFLDVGIGAGAVAEARVDVGRWFSLFGQARFTPLPLGGVRKTVEPEAERLATDRPGDFVTYRQVVFGASHYVSAIGLDLGVGYAAMELSGRHVTNLGHGALTVQLDYTIDR